MHLGTMIPRRGDALGTRSLWSALHSAHGLAPDEESLSTDEHDEQGQHADERRERELRHVELHVEAGGDRRIEQRARSDELLDADRDRLGRRLATFPPAAGRGSRW